MSPSSSVPPAPRVAPNAGHALGGIWRLTARRLLAPAQWLPVLTVLAALAVLASAVIHDGNSRQYFNWAGGFYLTFLLPIMAFLSSGGAIRDDLKSGTVDYVLTRPVRRPVYLVFKFLSHLVCLQLLCLLGLAVMVGVGGFRHIPEFFPVLPWLLLGQVITVTAFAALGFLCGVITSKFLVIGLFYGAIIEAGVGNIPIQLNRLAMTHHVRAMLEPLLPHARAGLVADGPLATTAILLAYAAVMLAAAAVVFSLKELAGARPTEA